MDVQTQATLHPDTRKYLDQMVAMMEQKKLPPLYKVEVNRRRALSKMLIASGNPPMTECDLVENIDIPVKSGTRPGRVYRGKSETGKNLPVVLYYHGGGFAIGGLDESEHECRAIAAETPAVVIAIEYRKTPEHPYPAPDDDCYDLLPWAKDHAGQYGGDTDRIILAGTSCGGCLATSTARRAVEQGGPEVRLVVAVTPWYDKTMSLPSVQTYATGVHLDLEEIEHYRDMYMPGGVDDADAYNSPAIFPALKGMPPHYILIAECDGVADDSYVYADKLKAAGVPVEIVLGKGLIHAFTLMYHLIPVAKTYLPGIYEAIRNA